MKENKPLTGSDNNGKLGHLLLQQMAENEHRMKLLNQEQALKIAELSRVQQELDELGQQYPGYKSKKTGKI